MHTKIAQWTNEIFGIRIIIQLKLSILLPIAVRAGIIQYRFSYLWSIYQYVCCTCIIHMYVYSHFENRTRIKCTFVSRTIHSNDKLAPFIVFEFYFSEWLDMICWILTNYIESPLYFVVYRHRRNIKYHFLYNYISYTYMYILYCYTFVHIWLICFMFVFVLALLKMALDVGLCEM